MSLSDDIPVPQCCRTLFASLAAPAGAHYEYLGAAVIPVSGGFTERQVQLINDFKPDIIMVTPSYMLAIADEFERQGLDARRCSMRIGIFGAEPWTDATRTEIEGRLGLSALDIIPRSPIRTSGSTQSKSAAS